MALAYRFPLPLKSSSSSLYFLRSFYLGFHNPNKNPKLLHKREKKGGGFGKNFQKKKEENFRLKKLSRATCTSSFRECFSIYICFGEVLLLSKYSNTPEEEEEGYNIPSWGKSMHPPEATLTTNEKKKTYYWYSTCVI